MSGLRKRSQIPPVLFAFSGLAVMILLVRLVVEFLPQTGSETSWDIVILIAVCVQALGLFLTFLGKLEIL